jgi:hypothetical protein
MIFAHPGGNTGVRGVILLQAFVIKYPLILTFSRREKEKDFFSNLLVRLVMSITGLDLCK